MDYGTDSVAICYCFLFFSYKTYLFLMVASNTIQAICLITIGLLSLLEYDYRLNFTLPISLSLIILGGFSLILQVFQTFSIVRSSVLIVGRISVVINVLTSLLDLAAGLFLLISCFTQLDFLNLTQDQLNYIRKESHNCQVIASFIIFFGLFGFWLTYLQCQTIQPFQTLSKKLISVQQEPDLTSHKEAIKRKFQTGNNYITDLTPKAQNKSSNGDTQEPILQANLRTSAISPNPNKKSQFRSENHIVINNVPDKIIKDDDQNYYYPPSTQTIRLPSQLEDQNTFRGQSKRNHKRRLYQN